MLDIYSVCVRIACAFVDFKCNGGPRGGLNSRRKRGVALFFIVSLFVCLMDERADAALFLTAQGSDVEEVHASVCGDLRVDGWAERKLAQGIDGGSGW